MIFSTRPCEGEIARAALFDVDGTLVDNTKLHVAAWREALLRFGHDIPPERIRSQVGKGGDNLLPTLLPDATDAERKAIAHWRSDLYQRDYLEHALPFPGVRPLFERLVGEGVRIVLASSSHEEEVRYHLGLIGCEDLVHATTSADDADHTKPCSDIFEAALAKVKPLTVAEAIVVGDTRWDLEAAARLGLRAIGFRCGGSSDAELAGACALYGDPRDLLIRFADSAFARHEETV